MLAFVSASRGLTHARTHTTAHALDLLGGLLRCSNVRKIHNSYLLVWRRSLLRQSRRTGQAPSPHSEAMPSKFPLSAAPSPPCRGLRNRLDARSPGSSG